MYTDLQAPAHIIPTDWRLDALRSVRDQLASLDADALLDARDDLAVKLSEAIGGLTYDAGRPNIATKPLRPLVEIDAERDMLDGIAADFEVAADDFTPLEILAHDFELPALCGGSPEAYQPTPSDWDDYAEATDDRDWYREIDAQAAGLPI